MRFGKRELPKRWMEEGNDETGLAELLRDDPHLRAPVDVLC